MADVPSGLREVRDSLHSLAMYLMEITARAQVTGNLPLSLVDMMNMTQMVFKNVIAVEAMLGPQDPVTPKPSSPGGSFDANSYMSKLMDQVRAQTEALQKKAFEQVSKQYEDLQKGLADSQPTPQPQPPVSP